MISGFENKDYRNGFDEGYDKGRADAARWIPCSERLPEEHYSMFKEFKNTDKWKEKIMFESISEEVIVTIKVSGKEIVNVAHTTDGEWRNDFLRWNKEADVIAWMPLPEPYREENKE